VERLLEGGRETVSTKLPVVISVVKEINEPRYPSFMGIRKANRASIPTWSAADLDVASSESGAEAARVDWSNIFEPPPRDSSVEIISAETVEEEAKMLADRLLEEKVI
jgi:electron transfer flavoprotein beta subunit